MTVATDICVASPAWETLAGLETLTMGVVGQCVETAGATLAPECELGVVFCDDARIRALNAEWRGVDEPTNVLSFPTPGELAAKRALGDIVIAYETVEREAREQDKTIAAHLAHLLAHGFLHLIGYDHETSREAEAMEAIERRVMAALGLPDPYEGTRPIGDAAAARSSERSPHPEEPAELSVSKDEETHRIEASLSPGETRAPSLLGTSDRGEFTPMPTRNDSDAAADAESPSEQHRPGLVDRLRALLGLGPVSVREDIEEALEEAAGDVTPQERALLKNVLGLHDLRVADAMVPRAAIVAAPQDATLGEVLALFRNAGHSRLPVYGDTLDDPRGMVHIRDFVDYLASRAECAQAPAAAEPNAKKSATPTASETERHAVSLAAIDFSVPLASANVLRPVLFAPPSMPALDLLVKMQAARTHMALVIDEYGGTHGLVSLEDIVEMIVGDIEDEHDIGEQPRIEAKDDGSFLVDAKADLEHVSEALGADLTQLEAADVTTLGGLVTSLAGHVPIRGEIIQAPIAGWEFEIVEADPRRVSRVRVHAPGRDESGDAQAR